MLTATQIAGFAGAGLAGAAYVPQISHLIRARCSAGISRLAFGVWLLASVLVTARAIAIHAGVFIVLGGIQIVATTLIVAYAARYKDTPCPIHLPGQPTAKTTAEAATAGYGPGSCRLAGLSAAAPAAPAALGRTLRADVPVLHPLSGTVTRPPWPGSGCPGRPQLAKATDSRGFLARLRAFSRRPGTSACERALRERCRSYLRQCTEFPATYLKRTT